MLVDSGDPYELYRHIANYGDYYAAQYKEFGTLADSITIERIEDNENQLHSTKWNDKSSSG